MPQKVNRNSGEKIMQLLGKSKKPLTAYDILAGLSIKTPPTVYRALNKLIKDGLVHRIESLNAFIPCRSSFEHDHADNFAVCKLCGEVMEIHDGKVEKLLKSWSTKAKFTVERTMIELLGYCRKCRA